MPSSKHHRKKKQKNSWAASEIFKILIWRGDEKEKVSYSICASSRCILNACMKARIQYLLRGHILSSISFLFFCLAAPEVNQEFVPEEEGDCPEDFNNQLAKISSRWKSRYYNFLIIKNALSSLDLFYFLEKFL